MASLNELKELNRRGMLEALRQAGSADRAELARRTGLSRATVSALVGDCLASGLIVEESKHADAQLKGRRAARLRLDPAAATAVGVDFGHRHVWVALADLAATVLVERRVDLDVDADADASLDTAAQLVRDLAAVAGVDRERMLGVGMGVPGPIDRTTGTVQSSSILPGWTGLRPAEELERRLGLPVRLENDANLGALAEFAHGAGRAVDDMLYIKVASGIGAGLILEGALHTGASGIAGEVGHVAVAPLGDVCRCGNRGCLETVASVGAVARRAGGLTPARLLELARDDDPAVRPAIEEAGREIGRVIAALCNAVNPAAVVVGGELGAGSAPLIDAIGAELRRVALPRAGHVPVKAAVLGARAEVLGAIAAALADRSWQRDAAVVALHEGDVHAAAVARR
jgi:predicted NBD/HSP70 family sugar kinase